MKLKLVGFFKELSYGLEDNQSIVNNFSDIVMDNKAKVIDYLQNGNMYIASPGIAKDIISNNGDMIGSRSIVTDGVWLWPEELSYYVEIYNIKLPIEFINHMYNNTWIVPVLDVEYIVNLDI